MKRGNKRKADQCSLLQMQCFKRSTPETVAATSFSSITEDNGHEDERILKNRKLWQDSWLRDWDWLEFNHEIGRVFCKICKEDKKSKSPFGNEGSWNVRTSAFFEHASSDGRRQAAWSTVNKNAMEKVAVRRSVTVNNALANLFNCAYMVAKEDFAFRKYQRLVALVRKCGCTQLTGHYENEKACAKFVASISTVIKVSILERIRSSPFFGVMVDESTDISTTKHLIMYATFLEGQKVITSFLGISKVVDGTAASIYDAIVEKVKDYELDTNKFVAFGSGGASVMTGCNTGVSTRLRKGINPFMINIHCVAHRTNLCLESASKFADCEEMCTFVDKLVNKIAGFFSRSTTRLNLLAEMEKELEYDELKAQDIQETRWLSRHRAIKRLCEILEPILEVLKQQNISLYDSLRDFKVIYVLHYLGDILQKMTDLSLDFQKDNVDVTTIWSLCNTTVKEIETEYLGLHADLNGNNYDSKGYPIIPDYGSSDGLLLALRSAVKGNMYRGVEMKRSRLGDDLHEAIEFQEAFSNALVSCLKERMQENELLSCLRVLAPVSLPRRQKELHNFGTVEINKLAEFFGKDKIVNGKVFRAIVQKDQLLKEFPKFRLQASTDWVGKSFADAWTMISCMDTWTMKYPELLKVAQFGLVQCCSTAACERGFSRVNMIKVKYRNQLKSPAVEALVRISIEGPSLETFDVTASIKHWRTCAKFRHIDTGTYQEIQSDGEDEQVTFPSNIEDMEVDIENETNLNLLDLNNCS